MSDFCVILCTCPNMSVARDIAYRAVKSQLAACVNIVPGVVSVYMWEGTVQQDQECQVIVKTKKSVEKELRESMFELHSYDLPEWVVLDISHASEDYADWIRKSVK
ncbi:divalent-cation tolerance protein CutA [Paraneptunicella aestuarii]|uniref:divalent-cation tolerance protein CutA n=1 Tax=Paraneptunicella aestuarii TaxID=2831148 RepID=UPI001E65E200|nr:divalent-cation tolerance protein CutA [Paraneptunicella aestuarii]UAA38343.1 divalent-cation tolerance protein CutA [Paraneptunicella aestuarii]